MLVDVLVKVTEARGIAAPDWSRTVPLTLPVLACGQAGSAIRVRRRTQKASFCGKVGISIRNTSQSFGVSVCRSWFRCQGVVLFCTYTMRMEEGAVGRRYE